MIELRKIKHSPSLSEETNAFTADIYLDGRKVGDARNQGTGGSNIVHWSDKDAERRYREWLKAQPQVDLGGGYLSALDEDLHISLLVEENLKLWERVKMSKRLIKKHESGHRFFIRASFKPGQYGYIGRANVASIKYDDIIAWFDPADPMKFVNLLIK